MDEIRQAMEVCPAEIRSAISKLPMSEANTIEEIRLRNGQLPTYLTKREMILSNQRVKSSDLQEVIDRASGNSAYAVQDMLRNGFLTIRGGHRIGVCGRGVCKDEGVFTLREISSVNIRIARQIRGIADSAANYLWTHPRSTLILAPPGRGKTTLLRDLIRLLSDRFLWRICVVDERLEIASCIHGVAQHFLGTHTDILSGIGKSDAIEMLLRSMNPQWIALDEITAAKDVQSICMASYCGVKFLATAHASCVRELRQRPLYQQLLATKVFDNVIVIDAQRQLQMGELRDD